MTAIPAVVNSMIAGVSLVHDGRSLEQNRAIHKARSEKAIQEYYQNTVVEIANCVVEIRNVT